MAPTTFTDQGITYEIRRTSRSFGSIAMSIQPDLTVRVNAHRRMPMFQIKWLLKSKIAWIREHIEIVKSRNESKRTRIQHGEQVLYMGREFPLEITRSQTVLTTRLDFDGTRFRASVPVLYDESKAKDAVRNAFEKWYRTEGRKMLTEKVDSYASLLGYAYNTLRIKKVSSIWGSCSRDQNLSFNIKLVLAPEPVIDYVVIHEVCHLKHKHHQDSFWQCVASFDPAYRAHRRWLKSHSDDLEIE